MKTLKQLIEEIANVVGSAPGHIAGVSDNNPPGRSTFLNPLARRKPVEEDSDIGDASSTPDMLHGGTVAMSARRKMLTQLQKKFG